MTRKGPNVGRSRPEVRGIITDLDGTLLRSDGSLSPTTMSALETLKSVGLPLVVATARTPRAVQRILGHEHLGRVVCANGAIIWNARCDEVIYETYFDPSVLAIALHRLQEALPDAGIALLSARTMFLDETYMGLRENGAQGAEAFSSFDLVLSQHRIAMVAVRHPHLVPDRFLALTAAAFDGIGLPAIAGASVDIVSRPRTKAIAAAEEMAHLGCPAEATVVFGDMPNDLPLFAWAGWAYAVANGHPAVLAAADEIVPSNDEDGVARTVHRLIEADSSTSDLSDAP